jgi:hypothetical protein
VEEGGGGIGGGGRGNDILCLLLRREKRGFFPYIYKYILYCTDVECWTIHRLLPANMQHTAYAVFSTKHILRPNSST